MIKQVICLAFAAIVALTRVVSAGTYSGGGNGTADKPYRISTPADMNEIGASPDDWGSHFVMVNDINLADYTGTEFNIIGRYYGYENPNNKPFLGVFDGNDYTISNFTYSTTDTDCVGLFGYVSGVDAMITDLTLVTPDVNVAGDSYYYDIGSLVGWLEYGTITGCGIKGGSVTGKFHSGGMELRRHDFKLLWNSQRYRGFRHRWAHRL